MTPKMPARLAGIMNQHIVKGKTNFKDLVDGQKLKTLSGKELSVKVTGNAIDIEGSRIQGKDMEASNGVVHSIDKIVSFK